MALKDKQLTSPSTYNIYDKGYRSGAQSSLFIGPIWVEEVMSIQLNTGSNDQPVYPYSSPYFDRLMLGNYLIGGTIGIAYTEPDYLLRIIQLVKEQTLNSDDLREIIERRKSVFANTLKHKLITEKVLDQGGIRQEDLATEGALTGYAYNYVDRITREIETSSYAGNGLNPMDFDMTIVKGNIYDESQSIEMYENVKINGTSSMVVNDDSGLIELYSFTGRKKPDRETRTRINPPNGYLSINNLMQMAREVASQLIDRLLDPPSIDVVDNTRRPSLMLDATRLAPAGLMNEKSRFYGREATFCEITYEFGYDKELREYPNGKNTQSIRSITDLEVYEQGNLSARDDTRGVFLIPPKENKTESSYFDNSYGKIIHPDRESTASKISAVAPVVPGELYESIGGSIIMPRYRRNEFDVGSFYPPSILSEKAGFAYSEQQVQALTSTTLWSCLTGFRNTKSVAHDSVSRDIVEDNNDGNYISEVSQPVFTLAYIDSVKGKWKSNKEYSIGVSEPCYIDYKYLDKSAVPGSDRQDSQSASEKTTRVAKRAKEEFVLGKYENDLVWACAEDGTLTTDIALKINRYNDLDINSSLGEIDTEVHVYHEVIDLPKVYEFSGEGAPDEWAPNTPYELNKIVAIGPRAWKCIEAHTSGTIFSEDSHKWSDLGVWADPHFFKVSKTLSSSRLVTDFNKCLYVKPFIFTENTTNITNIQEEDIGGMINWVADVKEETIPSMPEGNGDAAFQGLAYFLSRSQTDANDGCAFDFDYNWGISKSSGYTTYGQALEINGVYFVRPRDDSFYDDQLTANNGTKVYRRDIYYRSAEGVSVPSRKVHVFWLVCIMPVKRSSNEQDSKDGNSSLPIKVYHDISEPCGRYLQVYNITRCDVLNISSKKWYDYNPENEVSQAIKNAITKSFEGLINMFTTTEYTWPVRNSMERVAAFLRGYGCVININEIVSQMLKCRFSGDGIPKKVANSVVKNKILKDTASAEDWTFETALRVALGEEELSNTLDNNLVPLQEGSISANAYVELASIVRMTMIDKVKRKGMKVLEEIASNGTIKVYRDLMTPAPSVVSWGISTSDGYKELLGITSSVYGSGSGSTISLGGYISA